MSDNLITYVAPGPRDYEKLETSISIIRSFNQEIDIIVYHDESKDKLNFLNQYNVKFRKFERRGFPVREENRNSSYWRLISIKENEEDYKSIAYLDNDIYVVHPAFFEGFEIARNFGISMVQNPRMFIKTREGTIGDLDIGADVLRFDRDCVKDMPNYMTAYNMGVTFYSPINGSQEFLEELIWEQHNNPSRGQAGLYRTIWKTKMAPYCLPINWLVCKKHCDIDNPLVLHVGHENVHERWKREFKK